MKVLHTPQSKRFFASFLFLVSLIGYSLAQDWHTVHDGMEYAEVTRTIDNQPVRMNLLRLDLKKVRLDVVHAMDAAIGTEAVSSMATRHKALAAINAGFFRLDNSIWAGDAAGILMIDRKILSESQNERDALLIDNAPLPCSELCVPENRTDVSFERLKTWNTVFVGKKNLEALGINRQRIEDDLVVFTPEFGNTTLTDSTGIELVVRRDKVVQIVTDRGSNHIPADGFILSGTGTNKNELAEIKAGAKVAYRPDNYVDVPTADGKGKYRSFRPAEDIVAGVPQLIKDSKIDVTWQEEKTTKSFVETRHPRTAVAKLKDGKFLMITVDGRSESSGGISLYDLAAYLLELGATDAMNLDGGGSTTMFLDGKVVNHPSDKEGERKVSDAILVTLRKK